MYLSDPWNCLDGFIVAVGYILMSPLAFIFASLPVVVLRLLRLLRVFRLARALPQLKAIVEALLSGVGSVLWVLVLFVVLNVRVVYLFSLDPPK
jgi:voltage-gated sodium channel